MDELFNILSSSARINKSKTKKKKRKATDEIATSSLNTLSAIVPSNNTVDVSSDMEGERDSQEKEEEAASVRSKHRQQHSPAKLKQIHRETIAAYRNRLNIHLSQSNKHDGNIPDPITTFSELSLPSWWKEKQSSSSSQIFDSVRKSLLHNIEGGKWMEPTPIQMQSIPSLVYSRRDFLGCAPTGSGKSGAFIIPALIMGSATEEVFYGTSTSDSTTEKDSEKSKKRRKKEEKGQKTTKGGEGGSKGGIRTLLLAPSRELATQLHREVIRLGTGKIHGLKSVLLSKSNASLVISGEAGGKKRGLDVLVATPLRLVDCLEKGLDLNKVRLVVLDEADRLLDCADGSGGGGGGGSGGGTKKRGRAADDDAAMVEEVESDDDDEEDGSESDSSESDDSSNGSSDSSSSVRSIPY